MTLSTHDSPAAMNGSSPTPHGPDAVSAPVFGPCSRYWRKPPAAKEEFAVSDPPLALRGAAADPRELVAPIADALGQTHPLSAALLSYQLEAGALAADGEFQEVQREISSELEARRSAARTRRATLAEERGQREQRRQTLVTERAAELGQAAGAAGSVGLSGTDVAAPAGLESALQAAAPTELELAGAAGIDPPEPDTLFGRFTSGLAVLLAGVPCGLVEALALGTLLGLVRLSDLQRADGGPRLLLAGLLGGAVVLLLGLTVQAAVRSVRVAREPRPEGPGAAPGSAWAAAALLLTALLLCGAEVAAGAFGLRDLHLQRLQEIARLTGEDPSRSVLHPGIYWLIATLVSGPFVACKAARTWHEGEAAAVRARLAHLRREWLEARRAAPEYHEAASAAARAALLQVEIGVLDAEIAELRRREEEIVVPEQEDEESRRRLDQARAASVAQRATLDARLEEIVNALEPMPGGWFTGLFGGGKRGAGR